jgi:CheY-like chemotaxis protein/predicted transcriptional regulator
MDHEDPTPRPRGTTAAIRANTVVEPGGRELITLSVYCPCCAAWQPIDGRDDADDQLAMWASRSEVPGDNAWGRTPIAEIMTRRVVCVRDTMTIADVADLFTTRRLGGAPVVDAGGDLIGVITRSDVLRYSSDGDDDSALDDDPGRAGWAVDDRLPQLPIGARGEARVAAIMTPFAFSLPGHAPIAQAAALMSYEGVSRVVVVSPDGVIVGLLASRDVMRWVAQQAGYVIPDPAERRVADVHTAGPRASDPVIIPGRRRFDPNRAPRMVMIIDDDASVREDYAELLREEGYQVLTAANGREALDQLGAVSAPSLILLDLKMPVMDGWKFHRELADNPELSKVPVVLLSGSSDVFEEASRMEADDFLLKPVPVRELLGTVEQYCS